MSGKRAGALYRALIGATLWIVSTQLFAIDFSRYHTTDEINVYLRDVAQDHPNLVRLQHLGYSERGREINYVVISKADSDTAPALFINGTHHGNEKSGTEGVLGLIDFLTTNSTDPDVAALLDTYAIYIQPLVNPDGHAANSRFDPQGRDPNRDYSYPDRGDEDSFKVQPVRLVKQLTDRVRFRAAAAFHSGMEAVLWPWCYTSQRNADYDTFYTLSKLTARAMGVDRYVQSFRDYPTSGEFIDYVYNTHGTMALTLEVSADPAPPPASLPRLVRRAVAGGMAFMLGIRELDQGLLPLERAPELTATR